MIVVQSLSCVCLRPHGLQHARLPCLWPSPRACSNSCSSSRWCHLTISSSVIPFSSCPQFFSQHQGLFQWVSSSHQVAKDWSFSFSISPFNEYSGPISFRMDWLDLLAVQGTLQSLLQHHSSKGWILWCSVFFMVQLLHPYMTTGRTIALTRWSFAGKVMSLVFNAMYTCVCVCVGFPDGAVIKEFVCQCRRWRFNAWLEKSLWSRKWQPYTS